MDVPNLSIRSIPTINALTARIPQYSTQAEVPYVPVRIDFVLPIVDIPGCVEAHADSEFSSALKSDDPNGVRIFCDAHMPSFNAMDFTPELLTLSRTPKVPRINPPADTTQPEEQGVSPKPPQRPPIPKQASRQNVVVSSEPEDDLVRTIQCLEGERYVGELCEQIPGEPITVQSIVETYVPPVPAITSTAVIAVTATTSALIAKPFSDILLKLIKPAVKKIIAKIKKILGKKVKVESLRQRRHSQRLRNHAIRAARDLLKKT